MINHSVKEQLIIGLLRLGWNTNTNNRRKYLEFIYKERVGSLFVTQNGHLMRRTGRKYGLAYGEIKPGSSVHESIIKSYRDSLKYVVDFNI